MINSCTKGKVGERQWRDMLRAAGYCKARRGRQFSGGPESPDVICPELPNVPWEVKRCQAFKPYEWLEKLMSEAGGKDKYPTVAFRRNGKPWLTVRYAEHDLEIIRRSDLPRSPNGDSQ